MKINEKKSEYAIHCNIEAPQNIINKYPEVTKTNKYKCIPLIYEETVKLKENLTDLVNFTYKNSSKSKMSISDNINFKDRLIINIKENN